MFRLSRRTSLIQIFECCFWCVPNFFDWCVRNFNDLWDQTYAERYALASKFRKISKSTKLFTKQLLKKCNYSSNSYNNKNIWYTYTLSHERTQTHHTHVRKLARRLTSRQVLCEPFRLTFRMPLYTFIWKLYIWKLKKKISMYWKKDGCMNDSEYKVCCIVKFNGTRLIVTIQVSFQRNTAKMCAFFIENPL